MVQKYNAKGRKQSRNVVQKDSEKESTPGTDAKEIAGIFAEWLSDDKGQIVGFGCNN